MKQDRFWWFCLECIYKHLTQAEGHMEEGIKQLASEIANKEFENESKEEKIKRLLIIAECVNMIRDVRKTMYNELLGSC